MKCPYCGNEINQNTDYCPLCGQYIRDELSSKGNSNDSSQYWNKIIKDNENEYNTHITNYKNQEANKKRVGRILLVISILLAIGIFAILLFNVIIPAGNYSKATSLMQEGEYKSAIDIFERLGSYKDSQEKIVKCNQEIRNIRIAEENAEKDAQYEKALEYYNSHDYENAIPIFQSLSDYRESKEYLDEIQYEQAIEYYDSQDYEQAIAIFSLLSDYKESKAYLNMAYNNLNGEVEYVSNITLPSVVLGSYEQDNIIENGKEPIEWIVLAESNGKRLLVSRYVLDSISFDNGNIDHTWEDCSLRKWLNDTFYYEAFSEEERAYIVNTVTTLEKMDGNEAAISGYVEDFVFILSKNDAENSFISNSDRIGLATAYAEANGVVTRGNKKDCSWWLRTLNRNQQPLFVQTTGLIGVVGVRQNTKIVGVRPAIWVSDEEITNVPSQRTDGDNTDQNNSSSITPTQKLSVNDTYYLGYYEQDNNIGNGMEPIEWTVLDVESDKALLVSKYILDSHRFSGIENETAYWSSCSLRQWLNNDFYESAFSESEKQLILLSDIQADRNEEYNTKGGENVTDKVYILSLSEINKYFPSLELCQAVATDYAISQGVYTYQGRGTGTGNCSWWVRTPGHDISTSIIINTNGQATLFGQNVSKGNTGVRPAIWITLDTGNIIADVSEANNPINEVINADSGLENNNQVTEIKVGDSIILGNYNNEPIEWTCISIDDNGPLMFSDKVITIKEYDAPYSQYSNSYRKEYGSNYWATSTLRQWLNSDKTMISWRYGIPSYKDEPGFLCNFTEEELGKIKMVTQKTYLNTLDSSLADGGTTEFDIKEGKFGTILSNIESKAKNGWYENTEDMFFVLGPEQAETVYQNFGQDYLMAYATDSAREFIAARADENIKYWLRLPMNTGGSYENVSVIGRIPEMSHESAKNYAGVRPAFYYNVDSTSVDVSNSPQETYVSANVSAPDGAVEYEGHYYLLYDKSMTWTEAKNLCEELGGHLLTINSSGEQDFITELLSGATKNLYWIGLFLEHNGWNWVDGQTLVFSDWGDGEPNADFGGDENVVQIYGKSHEKFNVGEWNDSLDGGGTMTFWQLSNTGFICEWE